MTKRNRQRQIDDGLPPWTPFVPGSIPKESILDRLARNEALAKDFGTTIDAVQRQLTSIEQEETIMVNSRYQVNIRRSEANDPERPGLIHLSIKRRDKGVPGPEKYRDFMRIKDELVGPEYEGIEIYPARSREVDTSNQFHLWLIDDPTWRVPFGFNDGRKVVPPVPNSRSGARQAPFEAHHPQ